MEYILQTTALTKQYRDCKALNGLSMNVPKGAIYGFVGKHGTGKTTLMRLICELQKPSSGDFTLYGIPGSSKDIFKSRRRMGAVIETTAIDLELSAEDNLRQQSLILGLPGFDGIPELLRLVGLPDTAQKKARHFSLGMRQRLGIAMALCGDPDFLMLDEPANGLDPQGIVELRELILKLNRERGITVLISSHILDELHRLATHYGIIDSGQIIKELSAEDLEMECRILLTVKILLLRHSAVEIRVGFSERLKQDTKTLLSISSRDSAMCALAGAINEQLRLLRQERLRFQQGDRELKDAVTSISHDLRTPLTAICGYLDLLSKSNLNMPTQFCF